MSTTGNYQWIFSAGGPLVLLQSSIIDAWHGVLGEDYDNACAVTGYTGVLRKERRDVLVLADEPMQTTHFNNGVEDFLVRWVYGPDEETVAGTFQNMRHVLKDWIERVTLEIVDDGQVIIDSGADGLKATERLELSLLPGKYVIKTFDYDPSPEVSLVVHQLIRS
jgi:hypothetical protein